MQTVMKEEIKLDNYRESMRFKFQAAIAHPESAQKIFNQQEEEVVPDFEEYDPEDPGFSHESIDAMLATLEEFGFYTEEI